jgi:hypothetical protein
MKSAYPRLITKNKNRIKTIYCELFYIKYIDTNTHINIPQTNINEIANGIINKSVITKFD